MEVLRQPYAHDVVLGPVGSGTDTAAPGGAITVELCGSWDHPGPCPVAAHHTGATRSGEEIRLRILFATDERREPEVRDRLTRAVAAHWPVRTSASSAVRPDEAGHAARLVDEPRR